MYTEYISQTHTNAREQVENWIAIVQNIENQLRVLCG